MANLNISDLTPVHILNFYAYPKGHDHYGKIKLLLSKCDFKEGETVDIDTKDIKIRGVVERVFTKLKIVIVKMDVMGHKRKFEEQLERQKQT